MSVDLELAGVDFERGGMAFESVGVDFQFAGMDFARHGIDFERVGTDFEPAGMDFARGGVQSMGCSATCGVQPMGRNLRDIANSWRWRPIQAREVRTAQCKHCLGN